MPFKVKIRKQLLRALMRWSIQEHRSVPGQIEHVLEKALMRAIQRDAELGAAYDQAIQEELSEMVGMEVPIDRD